MNDNDIIKALEEELRTALRINHRFMEACDTENPDDDRFIALLSNTIKLIKHQKAEIERLQSMNQAKLDLIHDLRTELETAKAEVVKEFAERLKEHKIDIDVSYGYGREVYTEAVPVIEIENIVKEMVGGSNDCY